MSGIIDDSDLAPVPSLPVSLENLTDREVKTLRRALKRLRHEVERENERNELRGWQPAPGRTNVVTATMETIDSLMLRLPHPGLEVRS